jgi:hypothetical protein
MLVVPDAGILAVFSVSTNRCKLVAVHFQKLLALILTDLHAIKAYWESGRIAPPILDHGTRWR